MKAKTLLPSVLTVLAVATGTSLTAPAATYTITNDDLGPFAQSWTLEEDATVTQENSSTLWAEKSIVLDLAGHVLSLQKGSVGTAGYLGFLNDYKCTFRDSVGGGSFEVKPGAKAEWQGAFALDAQLVLSGGDLGFYVSNPALSGSGSIGVTANSTLSFIRNQAVTITLPYPLALSNGATLTLRGDMSNGNTLVFGGNVSGSGNFFANHKILRFTGDNTFSGTVRAYRTTANAGVAAAAQFADGGAVSPNMTLVSATNATVALLKERDAYALPALDFDVDATLGGALSGGTNVTASSLRKTGAGKMEVSAPLSVTGAVDLEAGTLKLARYAAAGAIGGRFIPDNWSASEYGWQPATYTRDSRSVYTNLVELSAGALTDASHELLTFTGTPNYGSGDKRQCNAMVVYDGWLWNHSGADETWTVAGGVGGHTYFIFDGEHKYVDGSGKPEPAQWNVPKMATFTVTPGAHHFQVRFYGTSPIQLRGKDWSGWTWNNGGVRIDRQGRASQNMADYTTFSDPGDGSFMTVSTDGTPVGRAPYSFASLNAAAGTTLDLFGNRLAVGNMSGFTTVTNSNDYHEGSLAVSGTWSLDGAAIATGGSTRVFGAVEWGEGATVSLSGIQNMARDVEYAILESSEPMASAPGIASAEPEVANVRLALSADGRRLVLTRKSSATVILMK